MKRLALLVPILLALAACGSETSATTVQAAAGDLEGLTFDVHETPG
jgi:ABC-type glycerol-3-phosphate transport system substrate-binding protein